MRRKKLLLLSSALCACVLGGTVAFMATADSDAVTFDAIELQEAYNVNSLFECPTVSAYKNGAAATTDCTLVFPDGTAYYSETVVLNQIGRYSLEYSAVIDGKLYTQKEDFLVGNSSVGSFTGKDVTFTQGNPTIEQYKAFSGVWVTSESTGVLTYNKVLNLSQSTKDDILIDMMATPVNPGLPANSDFIEFYITLTDIYDANNSISIKVRDALSDGYNNSYVLAKAPNQPYYSPSSQSGCGTEHSFSGNEGSTSSFRLTYDYAERSLYTFSGFSGRKLVNDFDDTAYINTPWNGFTTGEVILSVSIGALSNSQGKYLIKSIYGNEFSSEYPIDSFAPFVQVDAPETIPYALVNTPYKLFDKTYFDNSGIKSTETRVYYRYDKGNPIDCTVKNGYFTPNKEGVYTIVYKVTDLAGFTSVEMVNVEAVSTLPAFSLTLASEEAETIEQGALYSIQDYIVSGGAGEAETKVYLRKSGSEDVELTGEAFYFNYPMGNYEVVYVATDYVGTKTEKRVALTVLEGKNALLEGEIYMPEAFIGGLDYKLPLIKSYYFAKNEKVTVNPTITASVNGSSLAVSADGTITPNATTDGDKVKIVYKYTHANGNVKEYEFEVPVVLARNGNQVDQIKYFLKDGFEATAYSDSINFTTTQSGASIRFIRPVQAESFALSYKVDTLLNNADYFDITLTDKEDFNNSVTVRTYKDGTVLQINGDSSASVAKATDGVYTKYTLYYDNTTFKLSDAKNVGFSIVKKNDKGEEFKGFASNEVFVTIKAGNVSGDFCVGISAIANQSISRSSRDAIAPQIFVNPALGGEVAIGSKVTVYKASAYDVLGNVASFTVSVKNMTTETFVKTTDGKELKELSADQDYTITVKEIGRYQITYMAVDSSNRPSEISKNINAFDRNPPKIELKGKVPTEALKGATVNLPSITVTDKESWSEDILQYVYVVAPNGKTTYLSVYSFEVTEVGNYYVYYTAIDANGLVQTAEFVIRVK